MVFYPALVFVLFLLTLTTGLHAAAQHTDSSLMPNHQTAQQTGMTILNPYAGVDWSTTGRYRANLHTHTTVSDGEMNPQNVIDAYHRLGYRILSITDHDIVTYPWIELTEMPPSRVSLRRVESGRLTTDPAIRENRDPATLGMIAIAGNELSQHDHMGSYFTDFAGATTELASLKTIGELGGLAVFFHPGAYNRPVNWYVDLFRRHPHLIGLEVYNTGDMFPHDRRLWDAILTQLMPDRPVWAHSNDDMHFHAKLGFNYSVMLLSELTGETVRAGMEQGWSYFVYNPQLSEQIASPVIDAIEVDDQAGRITLHVTGEHETTWISNGQVIHTGNVLDLANTPGVGRYVRAKLRGPDGVEVGTQPFGVVRPVVLGLLLPSNADDLQRAGRSHATGLLSVQSRAQVPLDVKAKVAMGDKTLGEYVLELKPNAHVVVELEIPVALLEDKHPLSVHLDQGATFDRFRVALWALPVNPVRPLVIADWEMPSIDLLRLTFRNTLATKPLTATLHAFSQGESLMSPVEVRFDPAGKIMADFPLPSDWLDRDGRVDIRFEFPQRAMVPAHMSFETFPQAIVPIPQRGQPTDAIYPTRMLNQTQDVFPVGERRQWWAGPEDLAATFDWGWHDGQLWIAADVRDDIHHNSQEGSELWQGDAMQFGIAPVGGELTIIGMALTSDGPVLHQWQGPDGLEAKTVWSVDRDEAENTTRYRIRMPLDRLGVDEKPGTLFFFNAVVFDNDGEGWRYWMQLAPGLAGGRNHRHFMRAMLTEAAQ